MDWDGNDVELSIDAKLDKAIDLLEQLLELMKSEQEYKQYDSNTYILPEGVTL